MKIEVTKKVKRNIKLHEGEVYKCVCGGDIVYYIAFSFGEHIRLLGLETGALRLSSLTPGHPDFSGFNGTTLWTHCPDAKVVV